MVDFDQGITDATPRWLIGVWRLLRADPALDFAPGVRMDFRAGGHLVNTIAVGNRSAAIALLYRVDGDCLLTDNPAAPHSTSTRIVRGEADVMILDFSGARAVFVREKSSQSYRAGYPPQAGA